MTSDTARIKIFKLGEHVDMNGRAFRFGEAEAAEVIASYDPETDPAGLIIGHPEGTSAPAYGWVERLEVEDGILFAEVGRIDPDFKTVVNAGRYGKPSPEFYLPTAKSSPKPGKLYLKAVSLLGATPPACKGLGTVRFAAGDDADLARFTDPLNPTKKETDVSDKTAAEAAAANAKLEAERAKFAEDQAALKADQDKLAAERKAFEEARAAQRHTDHVSFAEGLVKTAKLSPAGRDVVVGVLDRLSADDGVVKFGEAGELAPTAAFRKLFDQAQPLVMFGEAAGAEKGVPTHDAQEIAREALAFAEEQRGKGIDINAADAVRHVLKKGN
jgi:hypothetical protein